MVKGGFTVPMLPEPPGPASAYCVLHEDVRKEVSPKRSQGVKRPELQGMNQPHRIFSGTTLL
jgi:hypothetical protein